MLTNLCVTFCHLCEGCIQYIDKSIVLNVSIGMCSQLRSKVSFLLKLFSVMKKDIKRTKVSEMSRERKRVRVAGKMRCSGKPRNK